MQTSAFVSTCGFLNGDANQPRTANLGFDCRVNVQDGLWGFCPTTVIAATDCGLAGNCIDAHSCSNGCGITGTAITTFTCTSSGADYCSTALLIAGEDQTYSYLACANTAMTVSLFVEATTTSTSPALTSTPSKTSASTASTASQTSPATISTTQSLNLSGSSTSTSSISSPALSTSSSISSSSSNNVGAIVGGVIGGLALVCFVGLALVFLRRFRQDGHLATFTGARVPPNEVKERWPRNDNYGDIIGGQTSEHQYGVKSNPIELSAQPKSPIELPI